VGGERGLSRPLETKRGNTIVAFPQRHPTKSLSIEEGDSDMEAEAARKLFKIRYAGTDGHLRSASFLVQRRYAWRGYQISFPTTTQTNRITLSAYDTDNVVATISIGVDSKIGLFVDALFVEEMESLRAPNRRVCEFTRLAIDEALRSKPVIAALFHAAYIYARRIRGCSDLVVEVNPRHVKFYERMLGFHAFGAVREDPRVQAPAMLLHLDLRHAEAQIIKYGGNTEHAARIRSLYPFFFSQREEATIELRLRAFD
jgi:GNAT superfamily N-acetyltransferase